MTQNNLTYFIADCWTNSTDISVLHFRFRSTGSIQSLSEIRPEEWQRIRCSTFGAVHT